MTAPTHPRQRRAEGDVVRGLLWSALGVGGQGLGQLALLAVLARLLVPADFGVVSASLVVTGVARMLTEGLIGPALTQRHHIDDDHIRTAFLLSVASGVAAMTVVLLAAPALAGWFRMEELEPVVRWIAVIFLLQAFGVVPMALLQRAFRFATLARIELASFAFGFATVGVVCAYLGAGVWSLVAAHVAKSVVMSAALWRASPHPIGVVLHRRAARDLLGFGGHHTVGRILNQIALQGDYVVVGRWMTASALGAYGRAYQLATVPGSLLGSVLDHVLFPKLASRQTDRRQLGHDFLLATSLTATLVAPVLVLLVVLAPEVVTILLGAGWDEVVTPLRILALGLLWRTAYKLSDSLAKAAGRVASRAWRQGAYAAVVIGGALVGTRWGLPGVATGVLVAIATNYLLMSSLSLQIVGLGWRPFLRAHLRGMVVAGTTTLVAGSVAAALRGAEARPLVVVVGAVGAVAIVAVAALLPSPSWVLGEDVRWLLDRIRRVLGRARTRKEVR